MSKRAYLVILTGQGDIDYRLYDEDTWNFMWYNSPTIYDGYYEDVRKNFEDYYDKSDEELYTHIMEQRPNERVYYFEPSKFDGIAFEGYLTTISELNAFCKKHNLIIQDEQFEGYIF